MKYLLTILLVASAFLPSLSLAAANWSSNTYNVSSPDLTNPAVANQTPFVGLSRQSNGNLTYYPLEPLTQDAAKGFGDTGFERFATIAYPVAITIFSILAVIMLTLGGIQLMTSEASASQHEKAIKNIQAAITGLAIILFSFVIIYTINPNFLKFKINITNSPVVNNTNSSDTSNAISSRTLTDEQFKALGDALGFQCGTLSLCISDRNYILYNSSSFDKQTVENYSSGCQFGAGSGKTFPGDLVGAPGMTGMVCTIGGSSVVPRTSNPDYVLPPIL